MASSNLPSLRWRGILAGNRCTPTRSPRHSSSSQPNVDGTIRAGRCLRRESFRWRWRRLRLDIFAGFGHNLAVEHRLRVDLPDVPAEKTEEFAAQVAADLSPEMSGTFGAIQVNDAGGERAIWTALGWQEDGSSVYLHIDPAQHKVELRLDTKGLEPPSRARHRHR